MTNGSEGVSRPWEFAGWGRAERIDDIDTTPISRLDQTKKHKLGTWQSTAICGNDITSSVLYVSALASVHAGALAPVVLLIVAAVLYLYRKVYTEVLSALPLNGGTYTVLLNTTNKKLCEWVNPRQDVHGVVHAFVGTDELAVAIFNPLISFLSLGLLPLAHIQEVPRDLLAEMGNRAMGGGLAWWVSFDAVLVLSGAVLTSFVGVTD